MSFDLYEVVDSKEKMIFWIFGVPSLSHKSDAANMCSYNWIGCVGCARLTEIIQTFYLIFSLDNNLCRRDLILLNPWHDLENEVDLKRITTLAGKLYAWRTGSWQNVSLEISKKVNYLH